jgi:CheY-like chemotaxis protein
VRWHGPFGFPAKKTGYFLLLCFDSIYQTQLSPASNFCFVFFLSPAPGHKRLNSHLLAKSHASPSLHLNAHPNAKVQLIARPAPTSTTHQPLSSGSQILSTQDPSSPSEGSSRFLNEPLASMEPQSALLVDDVAITQKMTKRLLSRAGFRCELASDGIEAVEAAKNNRFNVILMDVQLPKLNGVDATRQIRQFEETNVPQGEGAIILGLTGSCSHADLQRYAEAGMDGCIEKGSVVSRAMHEALAMLEANPSEFVFINSQNIASAQQHGASPSPQAKSSPSDSPPTSTSPASSNASTPSSSTATHRPLQKIANPKSSTPDSPTGSIVSVGSMPPHLRASAVMTDRDIDMIPSSPVSVAMTGKNSIILKHRLAKLRGTPGSESKMNAGGDDGLRRRKYVSLLVDDSRVTQRITQHALNRAGYDCDTAADGEKAVEMAGVKEYTVILMDVQLPKMDGVEATREIRKLEKAAGRERPAWILGLTGSTAHSDLERYARAGMNGCIEKGCVVARATHEAIAMLRTQSREFVFIDSRNVHSLPMLAHDDHGTILAQPTEH